MSRFVALLIIIICLASSAQAYWHSVAQVGITGGGGSFTGPGDIVSGAGPWFGLRGYSAAVAATGTQKAINVRRQSDNATSDILILTNGNLDVATATSFAGTDATCTGTIASTTLTCASASSTPNANDPVSGAGIIQPAYIVSCGTFTGGAGTCTLNAAQTVSVAETITMRVALFTATFYDQSGGTNNAVQATAASQPMLLLTCIGGLPCMRPLGTQFLVASGAVSDSQPWTATAVVERTTGGQAWAIGKTAAWVLGFGSSGSGLYAGSAVTTSTMSDNALHSLIGVANGASSVIVVDNTSTTVSPGANAATNNIGVMADSAGSGTMQGYLMETGLWPGGFNGTQQTNMCHNQFAYWGTATSC